MAWLDLTSPQVQAALIAAVTTVAATLINRLNNRDKPSRKGRRSG